MYAQYLWISKRVSIRRVNRNKRISVYGSLFGGLSFNVVSLLGLLYPYIGILMDFVGSM